VEVITSSADQFKVVAPNTVGYRSFRMSCLDSIAGPVLALMIESESGPNLLDQTNASGGTGREEKRAAKKAADGGIAIKRSSPQQQQRCGTLRPKIWRCCWSKATVFLTK
jgi:hypothetical protein